MKEFDNNMKERFKNQSLKLDRQEENKVNFLKNINLILFLGHFNI